MHLSAIIRACRLTVIRARQVTGGWLRKHCAIWTGIEQGRRMKAGKPLIGWYRVRRKLCHLRNDTRGVTRWSNLMATKSILPVLRHRFDENVFPSVNLEIATDCNYGCSFCPQSSHRRRSQYITGDAFRFVLDELKRIHFSGAFVLSVNNEPFMHPLLASFCEQISVNLPAATCQIISNGSLIKKDDLVFLARLSRPPVPNINDYTENHTIAPRIREWVASLGTGKALAVNISLRLK